GGQHGVVRGGAVALAEDEAVAIVGARVVRVDAQDPRVEHPQRVQRGGRALLELLVAGGAPQQGEHVLELVGGEVHAATVELQACLKSSGGRRGDRQRTPAPTTAATR